MTVVFNAIWGQPRVRDYLSRSFAQGRLSHAYLFVGPMGSGKRDAALALSQALICGNGGCGECEACKRIARGTHPDVHVIDPEGASSYLVEQVRAIVGDVSLAPIQASRKVYIITRADLLGASGANALLKTLEEPPSNVTLILLGRTVDSVLPTIVSRCQQVAFRAIPTAEAVGIVSQKAGCSDERAAIALAACDGSVTKAAKFAVSNERMAFRSQVLQSLSSVRASDEFDLLKMSAKLVLAANAPLDQIRVEQEADLEANADFLSKAAQKKISERNKRALSAQATDSLFQLGSIAKSWIRDVMMVCAERGDLVVNTDFRSSIEAAALCCDEAKCARALQAIDESLEAIAYNVSPQTCVDTLLLDIKEVLL